MSAPDDDTLRAMLAARTPGEWRVSSYFADDPPEVWARREGESEMVACIDSPIDEKPGPAATANADLCAAAPALAAEVLRLRERLDTINGLVTRYLVLRVAIDRADPRAGNRYLLAADAVAALDDLRAAFPARNGGRAE